MYYYLFKKIYSGFVTSIGQKKTTELPCQLFVESHFYKLYKKNFYCPSFKVVSAVTHLIYLSIFIYLYLTPNLVINTIASEVKMNVESVYIILKYVILSKRFCFC
jgi:hypothetical protein